MKNVYVFIVSKKILLNILLIVIFLTTFLYPEKASAQNKIGGIELGKLTDYLFVFTNGSTDANWQGATKGFAGNVAINGMEAKERTSGSVPFAGSLFTNDAALANWENIIHLNTSPRISISQASGVHNQSSRIEGLINDFKNAFDEINLLSASAGYSGVSATSLNNLNTQNGNPEIYVINITSGMQVSSSINITGDADDFFILRWDSDANFSNGYQGKVKFQSGGGIVPHGELIATNFVNVAGDINSSGGGDNPPAPYPHGPRLNNGTGALISGGKDFKGGGFFTGYWLTTGDPSDGTTSSLSNAIFVGGWYSNTNKFSMTSGTSGVYVAKPCISCFWARNDRSTQNTQQSTMFDFIVKPDKENNKRIDLYWSTSFEINTSHFIIEKSTNGNDFFDVGILSAYSNRVGKASYNFTDNLENFNEHIYYYRIKMVFNDGRVQYSDIHNVGMDNISKVTIQLLLYPNPVKDQLIIKLPTTWQNKKVRYEIYKVNGEPVLKKFNNESSLTESINTSNLPKGIYIVRVICNGETTQQKIIKR